MTAMSRIRWRNSSNCPVWDVEQRSWCWVMCSAAPVLPLTPTSSGWLTALGGPTVQTPMWSNETLPHYLNPKITPRSPTGLFSWDVESVTQNVRRAVPVRWQNGARRRDGGDQPRGRQTVTVL